MSPVPQTQGLALALAEREKRRRGDPLYAFRSAQTPEEKEAAKARILEKAEPVSGWRRFEAKFKATEKGTQENLEHYFETVVPLGENNFAIQHKGKLLVLEDAAKKSGLTELGRDILDVAPEVGEALIGAAGGVYGALAGGAAGAAGGTPTGPGAVATTVGGALIGGAVGAMAGRAARQFGSSLSPGEDYPRGVKGLVEETLDVAKIGAEDIAFGGILTGLGSSAGKAYKAITKKVPLSRVAKIAKEAGEEGAYKGAPKAERELRLIRGAQGEAPQTRAEMLFETPRELEAIEQQQKLSELWPAEARTFDVRKTEQLTRRASDIYQSIGTGARTAEAAINEMTLVKQARIAKINSALDNIGSPKYARLRELARGRKVMGAPLAANHLEQEILRRPQTASKGMRELRNQLLKSSTVDDFIAFRARARSVAQGGFRLDKKLSKGQNMRLGKQVLDLISQDVDNLATGRGGEFARQFKEASDFWRAGKQAIEQEESTALAWALKKVSGGTDLAKLSAEDTRDQAKLVDVLLSPKGITPTRIREIFKEADKVAPRAADDLRRAVVEEILGKSTEDTATRAGVYVRRRGLGDAPLDVRKFSNEMFKSRTLQKLKALLGDGPTFGAIKALADVSQVTGAARGELAYTAAQRGALPALARTAGAAGGVAAAGGPGRIAGAGIAEPILRPLRRIAHPKKLLEAVMDPKSAVLLTSYLKPPRRLTTRAQITLWRSRLAERLARRIPETAGLTPEKEVQRE